MPNLKDIRRRIRSVKNMQQITKAMKMVSAARLRRAQERVVSARPYVNTMTRVLENLATRAEGYSDPLLDQRGDENYLLVLVTADKGLCGAFNTNLIKAAQSFLRENPDKNVRMITVGRRGRDMALAFGARRQGGGRGARARRGGWWRERVGKMAGLTLRLRLVGVRTASARLYFDFC